MTTKKNSDILSNLHIFGIRHKSNPNPYKDTYIGYLDTYRNEMYIHCSVIGILVLLYSILQAVIVSIYYWISLLALVAGAIYSEICLHCGCLAKP